MNISIELRRAENVSAIAVVCECAWSSRAALLAFILSSVVEQTPTCFAGNRKDVQSQKGAEHYTRVLTQPQGQRSPPCFLEYS